MSKISDYGDRVREHFRIEDAPTVVKTLKKDTRFSATRLTCATEGHGLTTPIPTEDAHVIALQLKDFPSGELWLNGRSVPQPGFRENEASFYDLRNDTLAFLQSPFDCVQFYVPQKLLHQIADDIGVRRIDELSVLSGRGVQDPVMAHLARAMIPFIENPQHTSAFFVDNIAYALGAHLAHTYGGMPVAAPTTRHRLSLSQQERAKEVLAGCLQRDLSLEAVAEACDLTMSQFVRGFKEATGMPPHRWLRWYKIETAKGLLLKTNLSLVQIAFHCGFADQSHFTRVFKYWVGVTPGAWRRDRRS